MQCLRVALFAGDPPAQEDAERAEVSKHLRNGIMEPSVSPWAAANVFVPKKKGDLRTTTDFR
jgi:hypothetical protein